jgi:hypothetical protein
MKKAIGELYILLFDAGDNGLRIVRYVQEKSGKSMFKTLIQKTGGYSDRFSWDFKNNIVEIGNDLYLKLKKSAIREIMGPQ